MKVRNRTCVLGIIDSALPQFWAGYTAGDQGVPWVALILEVRGLVEKNLLGLSNNAL